MSKITVSTAEKRFPVAPDLYGIFFEDISRAGDGGLYPEMIRNRSFEDSLIPDECTTDDGGRTFVSPTGWIDEFNNGEGMHDWVKRMEIVKTPVPGWYGENASFELEKKDTLNAKRRCALRVHFAAGGSIKNIGHNGIPQKEGELYRFYCFAKASAPVELKLYVKEQGKVLAKAHITVNGADWARYDAELTATVTTGKGEFVIEAPEGGELLIGFTSLMPADTFKGHGLRKDLAEKLLQMNPGFMRFPGGCIVEGFSMETVMYFKNTVGPVWERPSHWLLWHYRSTNGLGFHEYLQLCEDLGVEAMYVCNCGMTCQGRGPYFFNDEEMKVMIQDVMDAFEYAEGSVDTRWGALRAEMGHPEPFKLKYLEIGNENHGDIYAQRFEEVRQVVKAKYPDVIILANDRDERHITDIVDDHYYNMPEFYAESVGLYDSYDRTKPDVFVGEFSVNQTYEGQHRAAVSEAMFMVGFERNQDKVKLCAYAPLFEHVHYYSWYPNLIIYDNYRSFAIPSYYVFRMFGGARGKDVVVSKEETEKIYRYLHGLPMVTGDFGVQYKNAVYNGVPVTPYKDLYGKVVQDGEISTIVEDPEHPLDFRPRGKVYASVCLGTDVDSREGIFDVDIYAEEGKEAGVGMLYAPKPLSFYDRNNPNPRDPWGMWNSEPIRWILKGNKAVTLRGGLFTHPYSEEKEIDFAPGQFHHVHYELSLTEVKLYLDGKLIDTVELPNYPSMCSVVTDSDEEIIIKIVNFGEKEDAVSISLDHDVESGYKVSLLTSEAEGENSLENPEYVSDQEICAEGAAKEFVYTAPALSVNVLTLKKK